MEKKFLIQEIERLKKEKNAVILAHNYQIGDVQDVADFVGDSLQLAQEAQKVTQDLIVFCGVHFMAESAKILNPAKKVLLPNKEAGCPMADMIDATGLKEMKNKYPGVPVVTYVNSSAAVKAESDICCTSSNALRVVKSLNVDKIIFTPDRNLATYVEQKLENVEIIKWEGFCPTHERIIIEDVDMIKEKHPAALVLMHPECNPSIYNKADFLGSTAQILEYAKNSTNKEFIIGTEEGILHTLSKQNPDKKFYLLSSMLYCFNMKKTTLEHVYYALLEEKTEVELDEDMRLKSLKSLERMLSVK
jgi:quinolinate synthase